MRNAYLVTYDIAHPRRLRKVFETMRGYGVHLQLSVFRCELSHAELVTLRSMLARLLHHEKDQVLLADLGPVEGRGRTCITSLGIPYRPPHRAPEVF